jgi:hypothetical protein
MKEDSENYPIWVGNDLKIYLEAFSPRYRDASDFLIAIAEP